MTVREAGMTDNLFKYLVFRWLVNVIHYKFDNEYKYIIIKN